MSHGIIAAGHEKTAEAASTILQEGGNAFDAIVGAAFASCAAEPVFTSLGGGGFLLAHSAKGLERVYDFFVQTPRRVPDPGGLDFYPIQADFGQTTQEFHIGLGSIATPGMVAGLFEIHKDLGALPIAKVMAPAIALCREGITINAFQEYLFEVVKPIYSATPEARDVYGSPSRPELLVREGDVLKFPRLAETLEALAREGADLFYRGEMARRLAEQCRAGGAIDLKDLESYRVHKRKPFAFAYRGNRILTNPPPSCGGLLIAFTLGLLERQGSTTDSFGSAADLFRLAHAMELTNQARAEAQSKDGSWSHAANALFAKEFMEKYRRQVSDRPVAARGTTHINVIDKQGDVASMSMSNGEGCGRLLDGTGIMLNNMLGEEDLNPAGFHVWQTNQRMSSMMSPTILFKPDGTMIAAGSGGSNRIRTAIVQVLRNLLDHKMSVEQAVHAPRIHYERDLLSMEPGFAKEVTDALCREFTQNHLWKTINLFFGGVHTIVFHPDRGFSGAGDPRRAGVVLDGGLKIERSFNPSKL